MSSTHSPSYLGNRKSDDDGSSSMSHFLKDAPCPAGNCTARLVQGGVPAPITPRLHVIAVLDLVVPRRRRVRWCRHGDPLDLKTSCLKVATLLTPWPPRDTRAAVLQRLDPAGRPDCCGGCGAGAGSLRAANSRCKPGGRQKKAAESAVPPSCPSLLQRLMRRNWGNEN